MTKTRLLRYIVEFPGAPEQTVSYNLGLGEKEAKTYAVHTASRYHGVIKTEAMDGTIQVWKSYIKSKESSESPTNKV